MKSYSKNLKILYTIFPKLIKPKKNISSNKKKDVLHPFVFTNLKINLNLYIFEIYN